MAARLGFLGHSWERAVRACLVVVACSSCGDGGGSVNPRRGAQDPAVVAQIPAEELLDAVVAKLQQCALYEPRLHQGTVLRDEFDRCAARCVLVPSCDDLRTFRCEQIPSEDELACLEACPLEPEDGFRCGDGGSIPHANVCDESPDCEDRSDEAGCPTHICDDGEALSYASALCDGFADCPDGSDEVGCAAICTPS